MEYDLNTVLVHIVDFSELRLAHRDGQKSEDITGEGAEMLD